MAVKFPPRGAGIEGRRETSPSAQWLLPSEHDAAFAYRPGALLLGQWQGRPVAWGDDRHIVTVAGSRAGKSRYVLMPNLRRYPGPTVVIDPKGELVRETAAARRAFGTVHVLDPFGELARTGFNWPVSRFNPFAELARTPIKTIGADAAQIADALIVLPDKGDRHWAEAAQNIIAGVLLHLATHSPEQATIRELRALLTGGNLGWAAAFKSMEGNEALDGQIANVGRAYASKFFDDGEPSGELRSIMSTAETQTRALDDLRDGSDVSDFRLRGLSLPRTHPEAVTTLYLVLPGLRIGTHARWLRLIIYQALAALERDPVKVYEAPGTHPVLFVLEEFAALGKVAAIETAAGYMASFGVKLWPVLQDLSQLKRHYPESWETFLGNAGMIQAFGNTDLTTTDYLSRRLGTTAFLERQTRQTNIESVRRGDLGDVEHVRTPPLLAPFEISQYFSKREGRVLLVSGDYPPTFAERWQEET